MNFHPILVHFPIAFLSAYSLFELLRFKFLTKHTSWFYIKATLLFLGILGALAAGISGKLIENQFHNPLIPLHEHINEAASVLFAFLAFWYIVSWIQKSGNKKLIKRFGRLWPKLVACKDIFLETPLIILFVTVALVLIMVGGALGGIIVYGVGLDPFTQFVGSLFGYK